MSALGSKDVVLCLSCWHDVSQDGIQARRCDHCGSSLNEIRTRTPEAQAVIACVLGGGHAAPVRVL